jgi:hypothetical protein
METFFAVSPPVLSPDGRRAASSSRRREAQGSAQDGSATHTSLGTGVVKQLGARLDWASFLRRVYLEDVLAWGASPGLGDRHRSRAFARRGGAPGRIRYHEQRRSMLVRFSRGTPGADEAPFLAVIVVALALVAGCQRAAGSSSAAPSTLQERGSSSAAPSTPQERSGSAGVARAGSSSTCNATLEPFTGSLDAVPDISWRFLLLEKPVAPSQDDLAEAKRCFKRAFANGDEAYYHEHSLLELERAYSFSGDHEILYHLGRGSQFLGRAARAWALYRAFLDQGGARVPSARRSEVSAAIAELEKLTTWLILDCRIPNVQIDDRSYSVFGGSVSCPITGRRRVGVWGLEHGDFVARGEGCSANIRGKQLRPELPYALVIESSAAGSER